MLPIADTSGTSSPKASPAASFAPKGDPRKRPNLRLNLSSQEEKQKPPSPPADQRRNLYVLGIPQDMDLSDFRHIFSSFGVVSHAVILAVLDSFNRRRGFVVMSSNADALTAMKRLSGTIVGGNKLHVSWAVVQRSNGFLDGSDRTPYSRNLNLPASPTSPTFVMKPIPAPPQVSSQPPYLLPSPTPSPRPISPQSHTLLLTGLHPELFQTSADVAPLVIPFGSIRCIKIIDMATAQSLPPLVSTPGAVDKHLKALELADELRSSNKSPSKRSESPLQQLENQLKDLSVCEEAEEKPNVAALIDFTHFSEAMAAKASLEGQKYCSATGLSAIILSSEPQVVNRELENPFEPGQRPESSVNDNTITVSRMPHVQDRLQHARVHNCPPPHWFNQQQTFYTSPSSPTTLHSPYLYAGNDGFEHGPTYYSPRNPIPAMRYHQHHYPTYYPESFVHEAYLHSAPSSPISYAFGPLPGHFEHNPHPSQMLPPSPTHSAFGRIPLVSYVHTTYSPLSPQSAYPDSTYMQQSTYPARPSHSPSRFISQPHAD